MKKTFRVYNENVSYITVDIPEEATIDEAADIVEDMFYGHPGAYRTEEIPDITDIEFDDCNGNIKTIKDYEGDGGRGEIPFWFAEGWSYQS